MFEKVRSELKFQPMEIDWQISLLDYLRNLQMELDEIEDADERAELGKSYSRDLKAERKFLNAFFRIDIEAKVGYGIQRVSSEQEPHIIRMGGLALQDIECAKIDHKSVGSYYDGFCLSLPGIDFEREGGDATSLDEIIVPIVGIEKARFAHPMISAN